MLFFHECLPFGARANLTILDHFFEVGVESERETQRGGNVDPGV